MTARFILALDGLALDKCLDLTRRLGDRIYAVKGHDLFDREGLGVVRMLQDAGAPRVWVDFKLHDIPNTVKLRARAIAESGAGILSVHASGEVEMMMAAAEAGPAEIYAVTLLSSLEENQGNLLSGHPSGATALYLARLAKLARVHGIVCSPNEVGILAGNTELEGLKFITPAVRSVGEATNDQKRVGTPAGAVASGATHIVVGRQVTEAEDPLEAFYQIEEEIVLTEKFDR